MSLSFLAALWRHFARVSLCLGLAAIVLPVRTHAADPAKRRFDLPAGHAESVLKQFSQQAGIQLVFDRRIVEGVHVAAFRGSFTPLEAAERLLAGTPLRIRRDERSGIVSVERRPTANPQKKARGAIARPVPSDGAGRAWICSLLMR